MAEIESIRAATIRDVQLVTDFIFEHGNNGLNYLPEEETKYELRQLGGNAVQGKLAFDHSGLLGAVVYTKTRIFDAYRRRSARKTHHGLIQEAVVHKDAVGHGIGTLLLSESIRELRRNGVEDVFATHDADNIASARMMEKNQMVVVDTYFDERRTSGSRFTVIRARGKLHHRVTE